MKPHIVHTLDMLRSRCDEVGKCWIWKGATSGEREVPVTRRKGKNMNPRRIARELTDGKPVPPGMEVAAECGQRRCISPHCSCVVTPRERALLARDRGAFINVARDIRMAQTKRARSAFSEEVIQRVRGAVGPASVIAAENGMSKSHAKAIRRGDSRKDYSSPFAGLGATA